MPAGGRENRPDIRDNLHDDVDCPACVGQALLDGGQGAMPRDNG